MLCSCWWATRRYNLSFAKDRPSKHSFSSFIFAYFCTCILTSWKAWTFLCSRVCMMPCGILIFCTWFTSGVLDVHVNMYFFLLMSQSASSRPLFEIQLISKTSVIILGVALNGFCDDFCIKCLIEVPSVVLFCYVKKPSFYWSNI